MLMVTCCSLWWTIMFTTKIDYNSGVQVKGTAEIAFVPDPANCQRYYIIAAGRQNYAVRGEALLAVAFDSLFLALVEPLEQMGSGLRMGQNNSEQQGTAAKESALSIYPNPSDGGIVNLEIKGDERLNNVSIEVYNLTGQLVASYSFSGENRLVTVNTHKLIPGVYFVKLFSNTQLIETKKLLINY